VGIAAFITANLMTFGPVFEVDAQTMLFALSVVLVLIGLFCEERRQRLLMWRHLKKDYWAGIRTVERRSSTHGEWE